jgi:hypothetical protein
VFNAIQCQDFSRLGEKPLIIPHESLFLNYTGAPCTGHPDVRFPTTHARLLRFLLGILLPLAQQAKLRVKIIEYRLDLGLLTLSGI